jgi:hypothetical protein
LPACARRPFAEQVFKSQFGFIFSRSFFKNVDDRAAGIKHTLDFSWFFSTLLERGVTVPE